MATPTPFINVIREYYSDDSFVKSRGIFSDVNEYQLCLAFATDSGDGNFTAAWDKVKVTPEVIKQFKDSCGDMLTVKVFVSIGGKDPFKVTVPDAVWINNAKSTLQQMIEMYSIDGIDVNYTKIEVNQYMFVNCINNLIQGLREVLATTGFVASLATDAATNEDFYWPLYQAIHDKTWIETVVFDCFVDVQPQDTNINPVARLATQVQKIVQQYDPKDTKVLFGYSAIKDDSILGRFGSAFGKFFRQRLAEVASHLTTDAFTSVLTISAPKTSAVSDAKPSAVSDAKPSAVSDAKSSAVSNAGARR